MGPDLTDVGAIRRAPQLERSLLNPDAEILAQNRTYRVVTREGAIEARLERHTVVSSQEALLAELDYGVEELRSAHPETTALGFGIPSRIDQRSGRAVASTIAKDRYEV